METRPLFLWVNAKALKQPRARVFAVTFYCSVLHRAGGGGGSLVLFPSFLIWLPMLNLPSLCFLPQPPPYLKLEREEGKRKKEEEPGTGFKLRRQLSSQNALSSSKTSQGPSKYPSQMLAAPANFTSFQCGARSQVFVFHFAGSFCAMDLISSTLIPMYERDPLIQFRYFYSSPKSGKS